MFGGSSAAASGTPAFNFSASPASAFGAASSSAFGAATGTGSLFGGTSNAPFGATTSAPAFGAPASSASLFGSTTTPSLFGGSAAATTPSLFGAPASGTTTPSLFGAPAAGTTAPTLFGGPAPAPGSSQPSAAFGSTFGGGTSLFPAQTQQHQPQGASVLSGKEGKALTHFTKWDDISDQGQAALLQLEQAISQQREDCRQLEGNQRLWGEEGNTLKKEVAADEAAVGQALVGLQAALKGDVKTLAVFREKALALLHDTELTVRTFQRTHRWRTAGKVLPGQALPPGIREQLNGPVTLPSLYLQKAVKSFQEAVEQYTQVVAQVEALLPAEGSPPPRPPPPAAVLPAVLHNLHDFFCHVAARLEGLHDEVATAREAFLAHRRQNGDMTDPFAEAERTAALQQQARQKKTTVIPPTRPAQAPAAQQQAPVATAGGLFGGAPATSNALALTGAPQAGTTSPGGLFGTTTPAWGAAPTAAGNNTTRSRRTRR